MEGGGGQRGEKEEEGETGERRGRDRDGEEKGREKDPDYYFCFVFRSMPG